MGESTGIEWADHTFNPWIGCTRVSPACDHCYAEAQASRYWKDEALWAGNRKRTSVNNWKQPLKWNREAAAFRAQHGRAPMVFCASLADVFDNQVPDEWRADLWELIIQTPNLVWLLLTKRPQNILKMVPPGWLEERRGLLDHVWFGTTVENQAEADRRIPHLLSVPAAKRFLSCEPLLGPVDLRGVSPNGVQVIDALTGWSRTPDADLFARIDWVIAGGESGREARPSHPAWFRSLRYQCEMAGVPFLFKQWGEWVGGEVYSKKMVTGAICGGFARHQDPDRSTFPGAQSHWWSGDAFGGVVSTRVGKKAAGRTLDGVIHDGRPDA